MKFTFGKDTFTCKELLVEDMSLIEVKKGRKLVGRIQNIRLPKTDNPEVLFLIKNTIKDFVDSEYYKL